MQREVMTFVATKLLAAVVFCIGLSGDSQSTYSADLRRPNIVLLMADDMGMGDTSAYQDFTGNSDLAQIHTPSMERLARLGVRFTDAHTPSSRCSGTRYGLLTGRYPWRNRLKYWVLFGAQGDPMIEADRPTLASMLKENGYATAMVGKWHVGLRYRQSNGSPAAGWADADLTQPLFTSPVDHGFDYARFTSRSHGTSGPDAGQPDSKKRKKNGPGHVHNRTVMAATADGKTLLDTGSNAYILKKLGSRHSNHAIEFLTQHVESRESKVKPFFLYYPSNSNHGPHTPDDMIAGVAVKGDSRTKSGKSMNQRSDFVYENDVALGRLINWLESNDDPRNLGHKLIDNTIVIFTSDNGAEIKAKAATGPFRSNKGSCFEGGHRVPFIVAWKAGGVGDGLPETSGGSNATPINLVDLFATFSEVVGARLPDLRAGEKGGEDSFSVLNAFRGDEYLRKHPFIHNDHSEAKKDRAASALRLDSPVVNGVVQDGKWKLFFDASLIRFGRAMPTELYNLAEDPREQNNLISQSKWKPLLQHLTEQALLHRNSCGHRFASFAPSETTDFSFLDPELRTNAASQSFRADSGLVMNVEAVTGEETGTASLLVAKSGLAVSQGNKTFVDRGEAIKISFDRDVIVDSVSIFAGDGACGGYYTVGDAAPLAIYCVDADNDAQDQRSNLSDIGVLKAGEVLTFNSSPHYGVEPAGAWTLQAVSVRELR